MTVINNSPSADKSLGPGRLHVSQSLNDIQGRVFHQKKEWVISGPPTAIWVHKMSKISQKITDHDLSLHGIQKYRNLVVYHSCFQSQLKKVNFLPQILVNTCNEQSLVFCQIATAFNTELIDLEEDWRFLDIWFPKKKKPYLLK